MAAKLAAAADWRDVAVYARLLAGDHACFAWEWLRRSPAYVESWETGCGVPSAFGLVRFEDPARDAIIARPFWHAGVDPAVLRGEVVTSGSRDLFDLALLPHLVTSIAPRLLGEVSEHILVSDGLRSVRIDLAAGGPADLPAAVRWHIDGLRDAGPQLLALRQLVALSRSGQFSKSLHRPERRARRWIEMLRVHDAIAAGVTHRDIAGALFDVDVSGTGWRAAAGSWRLRVQRLAAGARECIAMGPAGWLRSPDG
ncbi:MAG: DUF2285 domain-containing protein [Sphingomonas sp.]